jgi:hypothetical protein
MNNYTIFCIKIPCIHCVHTTYRLIKPWGRVAQLKTTRNDFRQKTLRGARVIDLIEELEKLEDKAKKSMETENKEEMYYWHGINEFSSKFKKLIERKFKIEGDGIL